LQATSDDHIYLIASNAGVKPGSLGFGNLVVSGALSEPIERSMSVNGYQAGGLFVSAGTAKEVTLDFATKLQPDTMSALAALVKRAPSAIDIDHLSIVLKMTTKEFDDQIHEYSFPLDPKSDRRFILKSLRLSPD
jgi:hypothetical protein